MQNVSKWDVCAQKVTLDRCFSNVESLHTVPQHTSQLLAVCRDGTLWRVESGSGITQAIHTHTPSFQHMRQCVEFPGLLSDTVCHDSWHVLANHADASGEQCHLLNRCLRTSVLQSDSFQFPLHCRRMVALWGRRLYWVDDRDKTVAYMVISSPEKTVYKLAHIDKPLSISQLLPYDDKVVVVQGNDAIVYAARRKNTVQVSLSFEHPVIKCWASRACQLLFFLIGDATVRVYDRQNNQMVLRSEPMLRKSIFAHEIVDVAVVPTQGDVAQEQFALLFQYRKRKSKLVFYSFAEAEQTRLTSAHQKRQLLPEMKASNKKVKQ